MTDLSTTYLGLSLKNPLVPSSGPLTSSFDTLRRLEDAGAAAVVLPSVFEEALIHEQEMMYRFLDHQDIGHHEADTFLPEPANYSSHLDKMLALICQCKQSLEIPVIGSLNGISPSGWIDCAQDMAEAGCDALELNLYSIAADASKSAADVENELLDVVSQLRTEVTLPLTVKISSQFSSPAHFAKQLEQRGTQGLVCFNRFYQPDIDLETLNLNPTLHLSSPIESLLRIRWIALLRGQLSTSLAATGGFHDYQEVLKALLAGADVVYLCSTLIKQGPQALPHLLNAMTTWMTEKEYVSVAQLKGSLSFQHAISPSIYERANYLDVMDSYTPSKGVQV
ncbi:MAG: dihydroorotate dehydrogenase-like protein [Hahellaceae bacterium]|nr:dihydroorotate dehydrogenase-like protein [Hahellaceae bacterium]MCP5169824.1 dihydroorotate dehydrogenase-like protein [Hahellaceae bacterium]